MCDERSFEERQPVIVRNIDFLQKWLDQKETSGEDFHKDYLIVEGYDPPMVEASGTEMQQVEGRLEEPNIPTKEMKRGPILVPEVVGTSSTPEKYVPPHGECIFVDQSLFGQKKKRR